MLAATLIVILFSATGAHAHGITLCDSTDRVTAGHHGERPVIVKSGGVIVDNMGIANSVRITPTVRTWSGRLIKRWPAKILQVPDTWIWWTPLQHVAVPGRRAKVRFRLQFNYDDGSIVYWCTARAT